MSNDFRIAGALGLEPARDPTDPAIQEVLTQGVGMPLRPISGTPFTTTPDLGEGVVVEGIPMQWMGAWQEGKYYAPGAFVRDGNWSLVANKLTLDPAAPQPDPADPESYGLPSYSPTTQDNTSVVVSGQVYTFNQGGWIKELRVWVTELTSTTNYRIIVADITNPEAPVTTVIEEPILAENAWKVVSLQNQIIQAGTVLVVSIDALNSGADTNISGGWRFNGFSQTGAPLAQSWTIDNQRSSYRVSKTDLDGGDRSTELEGVIEGSLVTLVDTENVGNTMGLRVSSVTDSGAYMTYGVTLQSETGVWVNGVVTTTDIDVPIALPTEYAEELLVWGSLPSWASSVEGFLEFNGVDQAVPVTNAYGVDILFEPASVSEDWDIVSFTG